MAASADTGEDPFRRLPDDLLRHVLSFLPDDDALQTCVLDTRWRDLWKSTTSLYFDFYDSGSVIKFNIYDCESVMEKRERFEQSVNLMIQLRGISPLVKCKIGSFPHEEDVERLVEYALMCQVKELIVRSENIDADPLKYGAPFISQYWKIMDFCCVEFIDSSLDFSNCSVLEDLKIYRCEIQAPNISSKSLKHLCITLCNFPQKFHIRIVAPGLISLQLDDFYGLTPSLGYMPFLVTAYVGLGCAELVRLGFADDFCEWNGHGTCEKHDCDCHAYPLDEGVLLNGLSNAVSLELTAISKKKLKGATTAQETIEQSFVCAHLKVVNIECEEVDEVVHKILKILRTCDILRDRISIKAPSSPSYPSYCFSFQKPPHSYRCSPNCSNSHH